MHVFNKTFFRKAANNTVHLMNTFVATEFVAVCRLKLNSSDITIINKTRCAFIIIQYRHSFSPNTTLTLFQFLGYMFRSYTQTIIRLSI
jgi:hypothetical protein